MSDPSFPFDSPTPAVEAFFLDRVPFARCLELQKRLVAQARSRGDGQIVLLFCEHPEIITVGRGGALADVQADSPILRQRQIEPVYVNRGGVALLHCPGQLAIYPIVPLAWHRFTVGAYLDRFQTAVVETLDALNIHGQTIPGRHGIWGRTGQLAAFGIAVRYGIAYFGAYLNVSPGMGMFRLVDSDPVGHTPMSSLMAERHGPVRMPTVRAALAQRLTDAFGCDRFHLYTGHPMLKTMRNEQ